MINFNTHPVESFSVRKVSEEANQTAENYTTKSIVQFKFTFMLKRLHGV